MAAQVPDKIKKADLGRFALRAAQLEKARPIVSYWTEYYLLQAILAKELHTGDDATSNYAVQLMDKLETTKAANASNDAITDDLAAKAYIENFALETFNRADESQRANKVTKQTADTFIAATTFMDLLSIWGEVDPEITAKSKFAKYHARRILQAFKVGEDPNATNPVVEEPQAAAEDGLDAELKALETQQNGSEGAAYRPATVTDDETTALPPPPPATQHQHNDYPVSPIEAAANSRQNSIGGGYFPSAPADINTQDDAYVPDIPPPPQDINPQDFYNTVAPAPPEQPSAPSPRSLGISSPARPSRPPPDQMTAQPPALPPPAQSPPPQLQTPVQSPLQPPVQTPVRQPRYAPAPAPVVTPAAVQQQQPPTTGFRTDDEATMAAQKHARWAISALNFEDVNTAVKELRAALQSLGAG